MPNQPNPSDPSYMRTDRPHLPTPTSGDPDVPPIALDRKSPPAGEKERTRPKNSSGTEPEVKDNFREIVETIVFVVVLVLLLKIFVTEAFVIPTGSMATTLLGYHHRITCRQCDYNYLVNASAEADPQGHSPEPMVRCTCPNCGFINPGPFAREVR